jgi:hypothetical protein
MSEWRAFSQLGPAFHLYVPTSMIDVARRLCEDMQISVGEFWAYTVIGDQPRFTLVQRTVPEVKTRPVAAAPKPAAARPVAARPAAAPRPAAPARAGANGQARTRARAAAPTAARSKGAAKKTARPAVRRAAPQKPAARAGRSAPKKSASSTRAQKRK